MQNYESITLKEELHIRKIYSIHYFEYMKDYVFDGESHDFWEFVFVDSGNLFVTAGDQNFTHCAEAGKLPRIWLWFLLNARIPA